MAENNEVKITFKAFNQEFNKAMSDMNKETSSLRQQMKLQAEQMKYSASETEKLQARIDGLQRVYEVAKQRTKETADALNRAKQLWGANSTEAKKMESQLTRNQIAEQQLANDIRKTSDTLRSVVDAERQRTSESAKAANEIDRLKTSEEGLAASVGKLNAEYELQKAKMGDSAKETEKLSASLEHLNKAHDAAVAKVQNYERQLEQAKKQYGDSSTEVDKYEKQLLEARTAEQLLANEISTTNKKLEEQQNTLKNTADTLKSTGDKMQDVGKNMSMKISAPILAIEGAMGKIAIDQQAAFAQTSTLLSGSEKDLANYKNSIRDLSSSMGVAFEEVAESVYGALSAGQSQADAVEFTEKAMKLAGGGFTDTAKAVDVLTTALNAYKLESSETEKISDMLIITQDLGKTTVDELASSMGKVIPIAEAQNVEFAQLATGYAVLTKNGIATAEAGTAFKAMLGELGKSGTKVDKILRKGLGKSFSDLQEEGANIGDVLRYLQSYADQSGVKLSDLFGSVEAGSAALTLASGNAKEFDEVLQSMGDSAGATQKNFEKIEATAKDKLAIAKETIRNALGEMGDIIVPIIAKISTAVAAVVKVFGSMPQAFQVIVLAVATLVAAIGPLIFIFGAILSTVGSVMGALGGIAATISQAGGLMAFLASKLSLLSGAFTLLTGPAGIAIAAIGLIIGALVLAYNKVEWFRDAVNEVWEAIKEYTAAAFEFISDIIETVIGAVVEFAKNILDDLQAFWQEHGESIMSIVAVYMDNILSTIEMILGLIKGVFEIVWPIIVGATTVAWETMKLIIGSALDIILGLISAIMNILKGDWSAAWEDIKGIFTNVWDNILTFMKNVDLFEIGRNIMKGFANGLMSMFDAVIGKAKTIVKAVTSVFSGGSVKASKTKYPMADVALPAPPPPQKVKASSNFKAGQEVFSFKMPSTADMSKFDKDLDKSAKKANKSGKTVKKQADDVLKAYREQLKTLDTQYKAGMISNEKYVAGLKKLQQKYGKHKDVEAELQIKINDASKDKVDKIIKSYEDSLKSLDTKYEAGMIDTDSYVKSLKDLQDKYGQYKNVEAELQIKINKVNEKTLKDRFDADKKYYDRRVKVAKISLEEERELLLQLAQGYAKDSEERMYFEDAALVKQREIADKKKKINEDFNKKVKTLNKEYVDGIQKIRDEEKKQIEEREKALVGFAGLFDEVVQKEISGQELMQNLGSQVKAMQDWRAALDTLQAKGISGDLFKELQEMGPKAVSEIKALSTLTGNELDVYAKLFVEKNAFARREAGEELAYLKDDTASKISDLKSETAEKLKGYQDEWRDAMVEIVGETSAELSKLPTAGDTAMSGLIDSFKAKREELYSTVEGIAQRVSEIFSGISTNVAGKVNAVTANQNVNSQAMSSQLNTAAVTRDVPSTRNESSVVNNFEGMFKGAEFVIREEADIQKLGREIFNMQQNKARSAGLV